MPFAEAVRIALSSLRANKLRSFLTVLGIVIGVSAVIAVVAITGGLDRYIAERVLNLGGKSFSVRRIGFTTSRDSFLEMAKRKELTLRHLEAVRAGCAACADVGGSTDVLRDVRYGNVHQDNVGIVGITENIPRIGSPRDVDIGRALTADDVERARPVAVIGADLLDAFFARLDPLGKEIRIGPYGVRVVGVAERKGKVFGDSQDNFVWIPITYFGKLYGLRRSVDIQVEARSAELMEAAQEQARLILRNRRRLGFRKPDDFSIETGEGVMDFYKTATRGVYFMTLVVTGMSLLVGGIVVMNIMLVSVTERIQEIGVRKALGARRRDVLRQFLVEAVVLAVAGGLLGVVGAAAFAFVLSKVLGGLMSTSFAAPVRLWAVVLALGVSGAVGLVAGIYPAYRAARLDPVTALRNE